MRVLIEIEQWAADVMSNALEVPVVIHDDGSAPGMHDLRIVRNDGADGAAEVVMAADQEAMEFWSAIRKQDGRWIDHRLAGGWIVEAFTAARVTALRARLPDILLLAEQMGLQKLPSLHDPILNGIVSKLRLRRAHQFRTDYPGSIYVLPRLPDERMGGIVPDSGDCIAEWASQLLRVNKMEDVRTKLAFAPTKETHAVVVLPPFAEAPFAVGDLMTTDGAPLPGVDPNLPAGVQQLWVFSTSSSGDAIRWSPHSGWSRHPK